MNIIIKKYQNIGNLPTYGKFSYEVIKESQLLEYKHEKGYSYHLLRFSTKVPVGKYNILPKLEDRIFIFLELEQHKGIKLKETLSKEKIKSLLKEHKNIIGKFLGKPKFFYSTGGGVNLIFRLDDDTISKIKNYNQATLRYHKKLHNLVLKNSFDPKSNPEGIYDGQRNILLENAGKYAKVNEGTVRLPFGVNPKYNYKMKPLKIMNSKPTSLIPATIGDDALVNFETNYNARLEDIFLEERKLVYIKKASKKTINFLKALGYSINDANKCINPAHEDTHPSMYVNKFGTAKCKACGSVFSTRELIEEKGGEIDTLLGDIKLFKTDTKLTKIDEMYVLTIIDHILRGNLISVGSSVLSEKDTLFNFNNGNWEPITFGGVMIGASILVTKVFKRLLFEMSEYFSNTVLAAGTIKKLKATGIYKIAIKGSIIPTNKKPIINNLIDTIQYYLPIKRKILFSFYPNEQRYLIPFKNKVYNAKTSKTHVEESKDLLLTKLAVNYYSYLPEEYKEIENLLDEWSSGQGKELATGLARTLSRDNSGKLILLVGDGANGKSALQDIIRRGLGLNRCSTLGLEQLLRQGQNFERIDLVGKSCNISSEISKSDKSIELESIKGLSVNADTLTAQVKHKSSISFVNKATFLLAGNSLPYISPDKAMMRRLQVFEFNQDYSSLPASAIKKFEDRVHSTEFLNLFFSYLAYMYSNYVNGNDLAREQDISLVTEIVKKHNDILGLFISEKCDVDLDSNYAIDLEYLKEIFESEYIAKYKEGRTWRLETLMIRLKEKGFKISEEGEVLGLRLKGSNSTTTNKLGGF